MDFGESVIQIEGASSLKNTVRFLLLLFLALLLTACSIYPWGGYNVGVRPNAPNGGSSGSELAKQGVTETVVKPVVAPSKRAVPPGPAAPVVWEVPVKQRAVFITIDDGWFPSPKVLELMRLYHLPLTAFLIQQAVAEHISYWQEFVKLGGSIEDHTYSHPFLTRISPNEDLAQISSPIQYFRQLGANPNELRPPYGDCDLVVQKMAAKAGIKHVVMWDAIMADGKLTTYNGRPLAPGAIVLMHWLPGLGQNLETLLGLLKRQNLGVASLTDALDGSPIRVVSPDKLGLPSTERSVYGNVYGNHD